MSDILPIVGYGSPILRKVCEPADNNPYVRMLIQNMIGTMDAIKSSETNPVGLAAPQVNVNARLFIMKPFAGLPIRVVINPVILNYDNQFLFEGDGCLSIPKISGDTTRHKKIEVLYYDENFMRRRVRLMDWEAVVFQHEYDHLNGVLFPDRMSKEGLEGIKDKLADIERVKPYYNIVYLK